MHPDSCPIHPLDPGFRAVFCLARPVHLGPAMELKAFPPHELRAVLRRFPTGVAVVTSRLDDMPSAIKAYDTAVASGTDAIKLYALYGRGQAKLEQVDLAAAEADFKAVHDIDKDHIGAQVGLDCRKLRLQLAAVDGDQPLSGRYSMSFLEMQADDAAVDFRPDHDRLFGQQRADRGHFVDHLADVNGLGLDGKTHRFGRLRCLLLRGRLALLRVGIALRAASAHGGGESEPRAGVVGLRCLFRNHTRFANCLKGAVEIARGRARIVDPFAEERRAVDHVDRDHGDER